MIVNAVQAHVRGNDRIAGGAASQRTTALSAPQVVQLRNPNFAINSVRTDGHGWEDDAAAMWGQLKINASTTDHVNTL
jgi:hypothetical protein